MLLSCVLVDLGDHMCGDSFVVFLWTSEVVEMWNCLYFVLNCCFSEVNHLRWMLTLALMLALFVVSSDGHAPLFLNINSVYRRQKWHWCVLLLLLWLWLFSCVWFVCLISYTALCDTLVLTIAKAAKQRVCWTHIDTYNDETHRLKDTLIKRHKHSIKTQNYTIVEALYSWSWCYIDMTVTSVYNDFWLPSSL